MGVPTATLSLSGGVEYSASTRWRFHALVEPGVEVLAGGIPEAAAWQTRGIVLPALLGATLMAGRGWGLGLDIGYAFAAGGLEGQYRPRKVPVGLKATDEIVTEARSHRGVTRIAARADFASLSLLIGAEGFIGTQKTDSVGPGYTAQQRGLSYGTGLFLNVLFGLTGHQSPAGQPEGSIQTVIRPKEEYQPPSAAPAELRVVGSVMQLRDAHVSSHDIPTFVGTPNVGLTTIPLYHSEQESKRDRATLEITSVETAKNDDKAQQARMAAWVQQLIWALGREEWKLRNKAMELLSGLGEQAVPYLVTALGDPDWRRRANTAMVLGYIGRKALAAEPTLIKTLTDRVWQVRSASASALVCIGAESSDTILALKRVRSDPNPQVRTAAKDACVIESASRRP
ncbi:MAG: HEAT repeat domain-containing protein [Deltaproteobacteria bacterium]|nr:HEAT repeat domain-containing protein [Deltaproteobacteria bacterium]